jgi:hypothetical protein
MELQEDILDSSVIEKKNSNIKLKKMPQND